ncbi:Protein GrpE [Candidatus Lokiarchaeum ossiferum]|uniref:Protein GrpE n=1 Tax=Candidatus Lokiarchaeum ossiferum TaxID=2951803 RepID=A0ABY6HZ34_9ARCH|nr:Protein GrpE [Candidatus Lokiarchaeum sp. B-35]
MEQPTSKEKPDFEESKEKINKVLTQIEDEVPQATPEETPAKQDPTEQNSSDTNKNEKQKKEKKKKEPKKTEVEKLQDEIKKKDKEIKEHQTKFAFLQAELENMRKHYIKQQKMAENRTRMRVITSFTPIIDSFEMAFKNRAALEKSVDAENCQVTNFIKGFEAINNNLKSIFNNYKVTPIEDVNIPFDYKQHEVLMQTINDDLKEDTVIQVVQKGYKMDGEVIRPAKVIISKKTPPPPKSEPKPEPKLEPKEILDGKSEEGKSDEKGESSLNKEPKVE